MTTETDAVMRASIAIYQILGIGLCTKSRVLSPKTQPLLLCYISAMEVARELQKSHSHYHAGFINKFTIAAILIIVAAAVFGGTVGNGRRLRSFTSADAKNSYRVADEIEKDYNEAVTTITSSYSGDIDYERATQAAIQGMLSTLDPHSAYFPYNEFKKLKEDQDSRFYGIGVTIVQHRDGVYVQSAVEGTPAAKQGLKYGDRIVEVDGKEPRDWTREHTSELQSRLHLVC